MRGKTLVLALVLAFIVNVSYAQMLKIGSSMGITSHYSAVVDKFLKGYMLAFKEANHTGGINGREIKFIYYDDRYDSKITAENLKLLIDKDKVDLLFAVFGTPPSVTTAKRLSYYKRVLFAPITGVSVLYGGKKNPWVFTVLPSYKDESTQMTKMMLEKYRKVGIVYLPNLYGLDCFKAFVSTVRRKGARAVVLPASTKEDAFKAARIFEEKKVDAIYFVVPPQFTEVIIKDFIENKFYPALYGEHYSGVTRILDKYPEEAVKFKEAYIGMFLPLLEDNVRIVRYYLSALEKYGEGEEASYEMYVGYFLARTLVQVLRKAGDFSNPAQLKDKIEHVGKVDVGLSEPIDYSPNDHTGLTKIFIYKWVGQNKLKLVK